MSLDQAQAYIQTVDRLEPDIHPVDRDGALASIAISLKRIADAFEAVKRPGFASFLDLVEKELSGIKR